MPPLDAFGGGLDAFLQALDARASSSTPPIPTGCASGTSSALFQSGNPGRSIVLTELTVPGSDRIVQWDGVTDEFGGTGGIRLWGKLEVNIPLTKLSSNGPHGGTLRAVVTNYTETMSLSWPCEGAASGQRNQKWLLEDAGITVTDDSGDPQDLHRIIRTRSTEGSDLRAIQIFYGILTESGGRPTPNDTWQFTEMPYNEDEAFQIDDVDDACRDCFHSTLGGVSVGTGYGIENVGGGTIDFTGSDYIDLGAGASLGEDPLTYPIPGWTTFVEPSGLPEGPANPAECIEDPHNAGFYWTRSNTGGTGTGWFILKDGELTTAEMDAINKTAGGYYQRIAADLTSMPD